MIYIYASMLAGGQIFDVVACEIAVYSTSHTNIIGGLAPHGSNSSASAMGVLQSCPKPLI